MSGRTQALLPAALGATGLSMVLLAAIWAFWPQTTPTTNIVNRPRPPQPTIPQAPTNDPNAAAYAQFWLEDQASAYAKQLETASGENRLALETLLNQTLAELAALKAEHGRERDPPTHREPRHIISVQSPKN